MTLSVVIPTWKRPEFLELALRGLAGQIRQADEIILGIRSDDHETRAYLASPLPLSLSPIIVQVDTPGVIASQQAALEASSGDIVCFLDDDAEPLPDWLSTIERHFKTHSGLGAIGGRDLLQYLSQEERDAELVTRVGLISPTGRMCGDHHRGTGGFRHVQILKGCNCAFRGSLLRKVGLDQNLQGKGAQTHWELALCLDVLAEGYTVAYDSNLLVKHHIAPRFDGDQNHRSGFSSEGIYDMAHNEAYVVRTRLRGLQRLGAELRAGLVGSRMIPGFIQWLRLLVMRSPHATARWNAARAGRAAALKTARHSSITCSKTS